jgi:hypothetical protein
MASENVTWTKSASAARYLQLYAASDFPRWSLSILSPVSVF